MPDQNGRLTPEDQERVVSWLQARWGVTPECPFHGRTSWQIGETLVQTVQYSPSGFLVGGLVYPLIVVTCSTCGFTVLVNAVLAGIVQPTATPEGTVTPEPGT